MLKQFHFSDVLSITTGRLVSTRHIEGVYDILNWMTSDSLFTHQLGRASQECSPVLCSLYPSLSEEALSVELEQLSAGMKDGDSKSDRERWISAWLAGVRVKAKDILFSDGDMLPVPRLKDGQHLHINPVEELKAMVGDDRVIVLED